MKMIKMLKLLVGVLNEKVVHFLLQAWNLVYRYLLMYLFRIRRDPSLQIAILAKMAAIFKMADQNTKIIHYFRLRLVIYLNIGFRGQGIRISYYQRCETPSWSPFCKMADQQTWGHSVFGSVSKTTDFRIFQDGYPSFRTSTLSPGLCHTPRNVYTHF